MTILACFLLCAMMGGVSELLFAAAMDLIKGRLERTDRRCVRSSSSSPGALPDRSRAYD